MARDKQITLRTDGLESLPEFHADERRLYNAFYNLINNAIPETPPGGSITVRGHLDQDTGGIALAVADTGRGMPPEIRDRLFSAKAISTKKGGTGLGTKIVKDVVDAHKGKIWVESEPGVGTTFHLRFPLDPGTAAYLIRVNHSRDRRGPKAAGFEDPNTSALSLRPSDRLSLNVVSRQPLLTALFTAPNNCS